MPRGRRVALLGGQLREGYNKMGAGKASDSPYKRAALPRGLFEGSHPLPLGDLPGRRGLCWKDVMWQGAQPRAGVGLRVVE